MKKSASLAQLAEQLTLNQRVVGSSPTGGTCSGPDSLAAPHQVVTQRASRFRHGRQPAPRFTSDRLPQYIGIPNQPFMTRPTYLGLNHQGFAAGDPSAASCTTPQLGLTGGIGCRRHQSPRRIPQGASADAAGSTCHHLPPPGDRSRPRVSRLHRPTDTDPFRWQCDPRINLKTEANSCSVATEGFRRKSRQL